MELQAFVEDYARRHDVGEKYENLLRWSVSALAKHLKREPLLSDLTTDVINDWLYRLKKQGLAPDTRSGRRRILLSLAADAARLRLIPPVHRDMVARVKSTPRVPDGLSWDQARHVLASLEAYGTKHERWLRYRYRHSGIRRRDWWRAYLSACWDTGAPADCRELEFKDIMPDGRVYKVRRKTGKPLRWALSDHTMKAIEQISKPWRVLVFPQPGGIDVFRRDARRIIQEIAGLEGKSLGGFRSGAGTDAEIVHGQGAGSELLGNTPAIFRRHYEIAPLIDRPVRAPRPLVEDTVCQTENSFAISNQATPN